MSFFESAEPWLIVMFTSMLIIAITLAILEIRLALFVVSIIFVALSTIDGVLGGLFLRITMVTFTMALLVALAFMARNMRIKRESIRLANQHFLGEDKYAE